MAAFIDGVHLASNEVVFVNQMFDGRSIPYVDVVFLGHRCHQDVAIVQVGCELHQVFVHQKTQRVQGLVAL